MEARVNAMAAALRDEFGVIKGDRILLVQSANCNQMFESMFACFRLGASIVVAPLSHGAGIHQLVQVAHSAKSILLPTDKFDVPTVWALVEKWRVTNPFTVPTILKMLVEDDSVDRFDHSSLRYAIYADAPMYRADQKRALEKLGPVLVQYFGLGEVTGNITVQPPADHSRRRPPNGPSPAARLAIGGAGRS
jgi:fatty-acyl-CoA synthase